MPDAIAFTAWIRLPGQLWQAVVTAATEEDAWRLLHEHVDQLGVKVIDLFVGVGVDPRGRRIPQSSQRELFR